MNWYERPLRIAALQCNYEGGKTLEVVDKWVDAGLKVILYANVHTIVPSDRHRCAEWAQRASDGSFLDGPVVIKGGCACDACARTHLPALEEYEVIVLETERKGA